MAVYSELAGNAVHAADRLVHCLGFVRALQCSTVHDSHRHWALSLLLPPQSVSVQPGARLRRPCRRHFCHVGHLADAPSIITILPYS